MEISKQGTAGIVEAVEAGNYNIWDDKRIRAAFNFGNGTMNDMIRYMMDNAPYAWYIIEEA
jgi:hypothetical protein